MKRALVFSVFGLACSRSPAEADAPTSDCGETLTQQSDSDEVGPEQTSPHSKPIAPPIKWKALPPKDAVIQRIAFGSCSSQYKGQPIWDTVASAKPDLFIHLGDAIYADHLPYPNSGLPKGTDVVQKARFDYALFAMQESFRRVTGQVPFLSTWDDHDFGLNDAGADFPHKAATQKLFLDFWGAPQDDARRTRPGVYSSHSFGPPGQRVQIILLDARTFRSPLLPDKRSREEKEKLKIQGVYAPHTDLKTTLLGEEQWKWLEARLKEPADVRLLGTSVQLVASEKGVESWGNFPHERSRLYRLIEKTKANGVVALSGDVHFAEISKSEDAPYPLYDFTSSNLAQNESQWGKDLVNNFRVAGSFHRRSFGQLEFDWEAEEPAVKMSAVDERGEEAFSVLVELGELKQD